MSSNNDQGVEQCAAELTALVMRWIQEYDLPLAAAVGILEIEKASLIHFYTEED